MINDKGQLTYRRITDTRVVIASYLADKQDEHKVDDVIAGWTNIFPCNKGTPAVSHTEIGFYVDGELWFFSSTSRPELGSSKHNGTRWVKGSQLLRNPDRWVLQVKDYEDEDVLIQTMIARANELIGMHYDFVGVVADFICILDILKKKDTIYCSKAVHYVLFGAHERISPRQMFKQRRMMGWEAWQTSLYLAKDKFHSNLAKELNRGEK